MTRPLVTPLANPLRGECVLPLGANTLLLLRPTFDALARLEGATGLSLIALARRLAAGEATLRQLQQIVETTAVAPPPATLGDSLVARGSLALHEALLPFLIGAITGEA